MEKNESKPEILEEIDNFLKKHGSSLAKTITEKELHLKRMKKINAQLGIPDEYQYIQKNRGDL